jgi:hypothetical protein
MDGAAHAAHDLGVTRLPFQFEAAFVQCLEVFLRALEEEVAQLGKAFVGEEAHETTSTRW